MQTQMVGKTYQIEVSHAHAIQGIHPGGDGQRGHQERDPSGNHRLYIGRDEARTTYFAEDNGKRTAYIFVDLASESDIPRLAEPWFLAFNASVELHPCMTGEDLEKAGPSIGAAVQKYG